MAERAIAVGVPILPKGHKTPVKERKNWLLKKKINLSNLNLLLIILCISYELHSGHWSSHRCFL